MKMMRKLGIAVVTIVAAFAMLALAGCGNNPEEVIRKGLTEELETVKNLDEATLEELAGDTLGQYEAYNIDAKEFMRAYFDGFDYKIGTITVNGDTASAEVTIDD